MANETKEQVLALVKAELPTLQALISLNLQPGMDSATLAKQELEYLAMQANMKPDILECTSQSVILAIKSVIKNNLTLDPSAGLVYIKSRSVNIAPYGQEKKWVKVLEIQETANGLISINRQCGRILDIERPIVKKDPAGKVTSVICRYLVPSYPAPRWQEIEFDESDFLRWKKASHKENKRGKDQQYVNDATLNQANPNYTSFNGGIDPEFARAKAIRHGLKKLGTNQNEARARHLQTEKKVSIIDTKVDIQATKDDTNIDGGGDDQGSGHDYMEFEDIQTNTSSEPSGPSVDIPNSNDL